MGKKWSVSYQMKGAPFFVSTIKNISIDIAERCIKGGLMKIIDSKSLGRQSELYFQKERLKLQRKERLWQYR